MKLLIGSRPGSSGQLSRGSSPASGQRKLGVASAGVSSIWSPPLYAGLSGQGLAASISANTSCALWNAAFAAGTPQ